MNEIFGLNERAWKLWLSYRNQGKKKLNEMSLERQAKKLASFGDMQMEVVEQSIERGWTGLFELPKKQVQAMQNAKKQADGEARRFADLRARAEKIGFRAPLPGEDSALYQMLVARAEDLDWKRRRSAPVSINELLGAKS